MAEEDYEKGRAVGHGSMATVYEGIDRQLDRQVAIKVLGGKRAQNAEFVRRFLAEARKMASVSHAHVLTIHGVEQSHETPWIIMELADGGTLKELIETGPTQPENAIRILREVLLGLRAIHAKGIVHRDIKPANIFCCNGTYKIGDFGVARRGDEDTLLFDLPKYVAPEQLKGEEEPGAPADIYSLGLVMYELLLGEERFREVAGERVRVSGGLEPGEELPEGRFWYQLHLVEQDLPPLQAVSPRIPPGLSDLVAGMTRKEPAERYQTVDDVRRAVDAVSTPSGSEEPPTGKVERPVRRQLSPWVWVGAAGVFLLLLAVAAVLVLRARTPVVEITSDPSKAELLVGDEPVGETPATLRVRIGTELLFRKEGYEPAKATVESREQRALHVVLVPSTVVLEAISRPSGAELRIAGEMLGSTPLRLEVAPGTEVVFSKVGYEDRRAVVERGSERLEVTLLPAAVEPGALSDASNVAAAVRRLVTADEATALELRGGGGGAATVQVGATLDLVASSSRSGYVTLFGITAGGTVVCFYPNFQRTVVEIARGTTLPLPLPDDRQRGFQIQTEPPPGRDLLFLLVTPAPPAALPSAGIPDEPWQRRYPYRSGAHYNPAAEFVRWLVEERRAAPAGSRLAALELQVVPR